MLCDASGTNTRGYLARTGMSDPHCYHAFAVAHKAYEFLRSSSDDCAATYSRTVIEGRTHSARPMPYASHLLLIRPNRPP